MSDPQAENHRAVLRLLTPKGMAAKARLTNHFLGRKLAEYEALKEEIERLRAEAAGADDWVR